MKYRPLDAAGDYTIGQNFLSNTPATVAQAIKTRLLLWTGEWFLDKTDGTPWAAKVLGPRANSNPDAAIKQRILGTPGVVAILEYSSNFNGGDRSFAVSVSVQTEFGNASLTQVLA
jgi:hypothetical protein